MLKALSSNGFGRLSRFQNCPRYIQRKDRPVTVLGATSVSWHLAAASVFILHEGDDMDGKHGKIDIIVKLKITIFGVALFRWPSSSGFCWWFWLSHWKWTVMLFQMWHPQFQDSVMTHALGNDTIVDWRVNWWIPAALCILSLQWKQISFMMLVLKRRYDPKHLLKVAYSAWQSCWWWWGAWCWLWR